MSSSAKRVQKLRKNQSDEEWKAQNAKDAERMRKKRAAAKNAKIKDSQQLDQKTSLESSSLLHDMLQNLEKDATKEGFHVKKRLLKEMLQNLEKDATKQGFHVKKQLLKEMLQNLEKDATKQGFHVKKQLLKDMLQNLEKEATKQGFHVKKRLLKGFNIAQHDNRDSQFGCGDAAKIMCI